MHCFCVKLVKQKKTLTKMKSCGKFTANYSVFQNYLAEFALDATSEIPCPFLVHCVLLTIHIMIMSLVAKCFRYWICVPKVCQNCVISILLFSLPGTYLDIYIDQRIVGNNSVSFKFKRTISVTCSFKWILYSLQGLKKSKLEKRTVMGSLNQCWGQYGGTIID